MFRQNLRLSPALPLIMCEALECWAIAWASASIAGFWQHGCFQKCLTNEIEHWLWKCPRGSPDCRFVGSKIGLIHQYSECDLYIHYKTPAAPFLNFFLLRYQSELGPVLIPHPFSSAGGSSCGSSGPVLEVRWSTQQQSSPAAVYWAHTLHDVPVLRLPRHVWQHTRSH